MPDANNEYDYEIEKCLEDSFTKHKVLDYKEINRYWKVFVNDVKNSRRPELINFYLHIPFCPQRCHECNYYTIIPERNDVDSYINYLCRVFDYFKGTFRGTEFMNIYIGGGTPSTLSANQMERLFCHIFNSFRFKDAGKTFECRPDNMTEDKFRVLKRYGFNR